MLYGECYPKYMLIHLVRHGESEYHAENRYASLKDIKLSQAGILQAVNLKKWVGTQKIDLIISSDLLRALETAQPAAKSNGIDLEIDSRFREVDFGEIEGLTPEEMSLDFPDIFESFNQFPASTIFPNGESGISAVSRGLSALVDLSMRDNLGEVLIVFHGTLLRLLLCKTLGIEIDNYRKVFPRIVNCAITTIEIPRTSDSSGLLNSCKLIRFNKDIV